MDTKIYLEQPTKLPKLDCDYMSTICTMSLPRWRLKAAKNKLKNEDLGRPCR